MPRAFIFIALVMVLAVSGAYGYRLYRNGQCCVPRGPVAEQATPLIDDALSTRAVAQ
jgi:hypothetical protein